MSGAVVLVILAFVATAIVTVLSISRFTVLTKLPSYVLVALFCAVYIPLSIVVLVPLDVMNTVTETLSETSIYAMWRVLYWLAFASTWAILPTLQSYVESGYNEPFKKFTSALRKNARYQLILLGCGLLALVYAILSTGLVLASLKSLVIALAHCYSLVLAIWLMGHGLVNFPRKIWHSVNARRRAVHCYSSAVRASDSLADADAAYAAVCQEIVSLIPYKNQGPYLEWIDELIEQTQISLFRGHVPLDENALRNAQTRASSRRITLNNVNEKYLADLGSRFLVCRSRLIRYNADWQLLLRQCSKAEDIIRAGAAPGRELQFRLTRFQHSFLSLRTEFIYSAYVQPWLLRILAGVLSVLSLFIVWSEVLHGTPVNLIDITIRSSNRGQIFISGLFLLYMFTCALVSLTNLRIFNVYALVPKSSDLSSLLFYSSYACRLTVPLAYNYLMLIPSRECVFEEFLGKSINLTPLGHGFNDWLPRFVLVPVLLTLFHFYDKIKSFLGFGLSLDGFDESDEENAMSSSSNDHEGQQLVDKALTDSRYKYCIKDPSWTGFSNMEASHNIPYSDEPNSDFGQDVLSGVRSFFGRLGTQVRDGYEHLSSRS